MLMLYIYSHGLIYHMNSQNYNIEFQYNSFKYMIFVDRRFDGKTGHSSG